ncbi:Mv-ORF36 peptide [Maruca vitrata nucleopolyhedrovirus]|uniref:Mv-ORF36 peptide n=1 Tax=Maruca vitrata nucleopolyhedrovirus TaxID=1307954 RepID=A1YR98_9ABAC|nr:Mv-ORF36 peptide [Maruca vitrata nucleopolyhedrovirus]ABL75988.1 Mv-ORF36 peptide [Maruca vitrata nucleopolyhedrovirus]
MSKRVRERSYISDETVKRTRQTQQCSARNESFLGFCNLEEIDYYQCLKMQYVPDRKFDVNFILTVYRMANVVTKQVRPYNSVDEKHHYNTVRNVLILIKNARLVLTDSVKKQYYDDVLKLKKSSDLESYNPLTTVFLQVAESFNTLIQKLRKIFVDFYTNKPDKSDINNPNIVSYQFIFIRVQKLYNRAIKQKTKTITVKRPTTMNRIQIDWKSLSEEEQKMTRQEITEKIVKPCFEQFGTILHVYVCPLKHNRIIVEYANSESVQNAMVVNEGTRFTITEFSVVRYYNMVKTEMANRRIDIINKDISILRNALKSYT